ncbi:hypothetical protein CSW50_06105 [Thermus scotoductus]|uniref:Uncharacterized protein n=1 Tax=Thermus scotoductus TaxID=37636 RepID=A0A430R6P6_THESC|nr:hypothetical protein CSW50_06105 [Thermus scotoductus]
MPTSELTPVPTTFRLRGGLTQNRGVGTEVDSREKPVLKSLYLFLMFLKKMITQRLTQTMRKALLPPFESTLSALSLGV